ncbi:hypothetical protein SAMN05444161_5983 [Rhizobiales bacterium GAS191]|nr:hypothetical protein SAMN05444161_5983 [Rhizobiales bacterium GAS191]
MKLGDLLTGTWGADPQPDILSAFGVDRRPLASLLKMPEQDALSYGTPAAPTSTSPSTGNPYDLFSDRLPAGRSLADIYDSFSDRVPDDQSGAGLPSSVAVARGDGSNAGPLVQPASFITAQSRANLLQPPEPSRPDNGSLSDPTSTPRRPQTPTTSFPIECPQMAARRALHRSSHRPATPTIASPIRCPTDRRRQVSERASQARHRIPGRRLNIASQRPSGRGREQKQRPLCRLKLFPFRLLCRPPCLFRGLARPITHLAQGFRLCPVTSVVHPIASIYHRAI